jgi:hypothetical protein
MRILSFFGRFSDDHALGRDNTRGEQVGGPFNKTESLSRARTCGMRTGPSSVSMASCCYDWALLQKKHLSFGSHFRAVQRARLALPSFL